MLLLPTKAIIQWRRKITNLWNFLVHGLIANKDADYEELERKINALKNSLKRGEEIEPPWITFPWSQPVGWNQGYQQIYQENVWIPFYNSLSREQRFGYIEKWNAPEDWRLWYLDETMLSREVVLLVPE